MIELSRKKKNKRVFGVMGMPNRNNSRKERLIINSVGEGDVWIRNSNGYIENGDYIQSSNHLGYGEKQYEIYLCNYTVAKATMDCNFEWDSPLYNCIELEDGLKVVFIEVFCFGVWLGESGEETGRPRVAGRREAVYCDRPVRADGARDP
jgi:hypothetical protein